MASDLPPYEFLWIVKESAYGTTKLTPTAGVDSIYVRLAGANRFGMRSKPKRRKVASGGGFAVPGYAVSDQTETAGQLQLELCYTQAQLLLDWACTRVNAGQTTPWTTTEPPGDLASCSVFHGIMRDDGTVKRTKYVGTKVTSGKLDSSAESGLTMLSLGLRAQRHAGSDPDNTAFPAPADTAFPTDPVLFYHLSGGLTAGSALSYPLSLSASWENGLDVQYFASQYPSFDRLRGRTSKVDMGVLYTASPNWRADFEALTARAVSVAWTNTTHTVTMDWLANNLIDDMSDDLTPGQVYKQNLTWEMLYDTSSGAGPAFTFA